MIRDYPADILEAARRNAEASERLLEQVQETVRIVTGNPGLVDELQARRDERTAEERKSK